LAPDSPAPEAGLWSLLVLAVIQGLSEFLPVSSDGHLVLAQTWLDFAGPRLAIDVALHLGTLAAVLLVYRRDLLALLVELRSGAAREVGLLALGSVPLAIVGLTCKPHIAALFESARAAALGLCVSAAFLIVGERARRRSGADPGRPLGWRAALLIGLAQALAPLPGVSRSGTTIATALALGVPAGRAARFSFLLSVPAVGGAVLLELPALARAGGLGAELFLAILVTFAVGVGALRFLLSFLGRGAFLWCALYCLLLGAGTLFVL
jgi:undecaprenyl-diphosphatase